MKNTKKVMAALGLLPLAAFSLDVGGSIGLDTGYCTNTYKNTGKLISDVTTTKFEEFEDLDGLNLGINGRLTLNDFYMRGYSDYLWILSTPKLTSTELGTTTLPKKHGFSAGGALGYSFYFNNGEFSLAPEVGFAYQDIYFQDSIGEHVGSPFVGFDFNWMFSSDWKFGLLFNWNLPGFRSLAKMTQGYFMGPEAKIAFDYSFTDNWSMGVAYRFKYIYTGSISINNINAKSNWMTNNATLKVDYTF